MQTVNRLIDKYGGDAIYSVKNNSYKFYGFSITDLKKVRSDILERRQGYSLEKVLQQERKNLRWAPQKVAVMSRRPVIRTKEEESEEESDWTM